MSLFEAFSLLVVVAALASYINRRFIRMPTTIGVLVVAMFLSLSLILLDRLQSARGVESFIPEFRAQAEQVLGSVEFNKAILHGVVACLLFAGALQVDFNDLRAQKWPVGLLATVGVLVSAGTIGGLSWLIFRGLGHEVPLILALMFGALICPTDPVAVLSVLRSQGAPRSLQTKIAGESLFNDGVSVALFLTLASLALEPEKATPTGISVLLLTKVGGGLIFGLVMGGLVYYMLRTVEDYQVEILLTLALVIGGYSMAKMLHLSGPITVVTAGLVIGHHGRRWAMSDHVRAHLDNFWELMDELLNALLFVLIGLEMVVIHFKPGYIAAALMVVPVVLLARWLTVGGALSLLRRSGQYLPGAVTIMTWGGLRGGVSIALALSLRADPKSVYPGLDLVIVTTYVVTVFSILVQGLSISAVARRALARSMA